MVLIYIYILVMSYQQMINSSTLSCMILTYIANIVADDDLVIPGNHNTWYCYILIVHTWVSRDKNFGIKDDFMFTDS